MKIAKRLFYFLVVNFLVITTVSIIVNLLGINPYLQAYAGINWQSLALFCLIWGFSGSLISLFMSKFLVKRAMGVQLLDPQTTNSQAREILDLVYNQCRKAGMDRMPEVGVYEAEEMNAFATGWSARNSLIAFSSGILRKMNRQELEGVIGHEVSHIVNGDMITMTLIQGVVNSFVLFLSRAIAFIAAQFSDERNAYLVRMIVTIVLDILFSILGSIVVFYFSRQREFRADAGSARLSSREAMVAALEKIQENINSLKSARQDAYATLKIASRGGLLKLFSSHPPIEERIARLKELNL